MSRRKTVQLNLDIIGPMIKKKCRSYTVFCELMGRRNNWATDWLRKDEFGNSKPKNLPSPEEAAKMCGILSVEPEEILVKPEDISLVRSLIDEKKPTVIDDGRSGMSEARMQLYEAVDDLTDEQCMKLLGIILEAKKLF